MVFVFGAHAASECTPGRKVAAQRAFPRPRPGICFHSGMPPVPKHPVTIAWSVYKLWSRLPPAQRRQMLELARTHGPRLASKAASAAASQARRVRP